MRRAAAVRTTGIVLLLVTLPGLMPGAVAAEPVHRQFVSASVVDDLSHAIEWPDGEELIRVLLLRDYNTRVVLLGTMLLGTTAGWVGGFMLLRRQALVGDVVSHASLPGIALMFIVLELFNPGTGRNLPLLSLGATIAGLVGIGLSTLIRRLTRIKDDAALAIVLSVFFGAGIVLFTIVQSLPNGNAAGLQHFIFGRAASMTAEDVRLIGISSLVVLLSCVFLFKELTLLCFDEQYAAAQGWPVLVLDLTLMGLVVAVSVIGQQSVGLLLVVAMMIIPPAAARFWTDRIHRLAILSGVIGCLGACLGGFVSALFPKFAAGAVMVLMTTLLFAISMLFGARRGVLWRAYHHRVLRRRVATHDLLRSVFELVEVRDQERAPISIASLSGAQVSMQEVLRQRHWDQRRLGLALTTARRESWLKEQPDNSLVLTADGANEAIGIIRNHRMWEIFLIENADVAPAYVDRYVDRIEHVVDPEFLETVNSELQKRYPGLAVPESPHQLAQQSD